MSGKQSASLALRGERVLVNGIIRPATVLVEDGKICAVLDYESELGAQVTETID